MSNRYTHNKNEASRPSFNPRKQQFVPKTPNSSTQKLSDSLRHSNSGAATSSESAGNRQGGAPVTRSGNFVKFLPHDEAVASGLAADEGGLDPVESQRVVDLLNRELSRLLKLNPRDFWKEVAGDTSLHDFLESFLKSRSRWYDFPYRGAKGIVAGTIVGEYELSRRVYMVLYRISSSRDPGAKAEDSLSTKDHAVLLQEKKLLDLPKLLDICAIYGHENEDLTRILVVNSVKAQPRIHDDFSAVLAHFLSIAHTMYQRCTSSLEVLFSVHDGHDQGSRRLHTDYLEVMDFLNDAIISMDAFVGAYKHAAIFFSCPVETSYGNAELINTLAQLHDSLLPSLKRGFQLLFTSENGRHEITADLRTNITVSLKMLSIRIVNFGWKLLYFCYLSDDAFDVGLPLQSATKIFPAQVEDPLVRAEILIQTFREVDAFSVDQDGKGKSFLQHMEENYKLLDRVDLLLNKGWIIMDDEQHKLLSSRILNYFGGNSNTLLHVPSHVIELPTDEESAILASKISQIKDLFPNYGKGFLSACLEVYNQNPEEVIQRILEETLHKDLQLLDTSLEDIPLPKASSSGTRDKGKGKLLDSTITAAPTNISTAVGKQQNVSTQVSSSSSSAVGRYVRKSTTDSPDPQTLNSRGDEDVAKTAALVSQLEYDDEYDDSFDDLGLSVADSGYEDAELLGNKSDSTMEKPHQTSNNVPNTSNSKWGSRKKPQYFVKDGKNYSYKVAGSVAVANYDEAASYSQAQRESVHGLGRGGNVPQGGYRRFAEPTESKEDEEVSVEEGGRGRGRGSQRGRGRGGGRNHYRKDQAMKKHFSGLTRY
ncbi:Activating signal cointegrator 1 complex subunit 2 [Heracleum sosnowskyi]|uniref:Activating signal cointegrator 1 complex subunit 2 n=1 Tax=Heracleum sosnowskyi TaxID=360622 RepID=A0AAD8N039_9APIA|nr:Activating signal cointegrator 1 complex subunit 2 [Heracleum sosnowskyi]